MHFDHCLIENQETHCRNPANGPVGCQKGKLLKGRRAITPLTETPHTLRRQRASFSKSSKFERNPKPMPAEDCQPIVKQIGNQRQVTEQNWPFQEAFQKRKHGSGYEGKSKESNALIWRTHANQKIAPPPPKGGGLKPQERPLWRLVLSVEEDIQCTKSQNHNSWYCGWTKSCTTSKTTVEIIVCWYFTGEKQHILPVFCFFVKVVQHGCLFHPKVWPNKSRCPIPWGSGPRQEAPEGGELCVEVLQGLHLRRSALDASAFRRKMSRCRSGGAQKVEEWRGPKEWPNLSECH